MSCRNCRAYAESDFDVAALPLEYSRVERQ